MTIASSLNKAVKLLANTPNSNPVCEARILLRHVLECSLEYILINPIRELTLLEQKAFFDLIKRRVNNEPIAYLINSKEFYGLEFTVSRATLIPRSETELIVDAVIGDIGNATAPQRFLDLGTGTGCIAISLVKCLGIFTGLAIDISISALNIARLNALNHDVQDRLKFSQSNWFSNIPLQSFDIIVSNPPYINPSPEQIKLLAEETKLYEPSVALYSKDQGLEAYRNIARNAKAYLGNKGRLYLEVGYNQFGSVSEIFANHGWELIRVIKDLAGIDRCIVFRVP